MKILFVTPETPATGGGGIATYIKHATAAFRSQGHEVFTFSWAHREDRGVYVKAQPSATDRIVFLTGSDVWRRFPDGPYQVGLSYYLLSEITAFVESVQPDLIETTDFKAPLYAYLAERRAGRLPAISTIPVIGFNHGLTRLLYSKNGALPQPWVQPEIAAERQMLRWCDFVFVPSRTALRSLEYQLGPLAHTSIVNEPYPWTGSDRRSFRSAPHLYHLGRVSFSKGIDHAIHFANVISNLQPIASVTFIGKSDPLSFKVSDPIQYLTDRAAPAVKPLLRFPGHLAHQEFAQIFGPGGYSLNFSNQETFNYAFIEMLSHGLLPFIKAGTPMEEFLPDDLAHLTLPPDFNLSGLPQICAEFDRHGDEYHSKITTHVETMTDPARYVSCYEQALASRSGSSSYSSARRPSPFGGHDVTILMATYNNVDLINESVASIRHQDVAPARTVIIDDGSYDPAALRTLDKLAKMPGIEVVRSAQNEGLCATRIKLLEHADTPLCVFLDSDDLLTQDYLKKTITAMNTSPIAPDAVLTWRQNFGASSELVITDLLGDHYHQLRNDFRMTALIRTEALKAIGFSASMRNGEADDWLFWLQFHHRRFRAVMLGEALFRYRFAEGSMSWPWSEGQAALTGIEIANLFSKVRADLPQQAMEDLVAERIWHILNQGDEARGAVQGDTFVALYRWAIALRRSRPRLFAFLQTVARPFARGVLARPRT